MTKEDEGRKDIKEEGKMDEGMLCAVMCDSDRTEGKGQEGKGQEGKG
jgi:hypothetical protein